MICKEREDPSLRNDIHLHLLRTFEGEILQQCFHPQHYWYFGLFAVGLFCALYDVQEQPWLPPPLISSCDN